MKAYKFRLYPTDAQVERLDWTLARCCELYNAALQERKDAWNACKKQGNFYDAEWRQEHAKEYTVNFAEQCRSLTVIRNESRSEYQQIGSHVLQNVLHRVERAFQNFFRRVKCGQTPGYPRYQSRSQYESFCFPDHSGWKLTGNRLSITGIGTIKVKLHREIAGNVKTCTIKREGEYWYMVVACEVQSHPRLPYTDLAVGIDMGVLHFATFSSEDTIESPRFFRLQEKKLATAQQALARKKRGSKRRKKAVKRVATCHRKVRRQRHDFHHKQSRMVVDCYETIVFEHLKPSNMSRCPKPKQDETGTYLPNGAAAKGGLNKSIQDAGWSAFIGMVRAKAESAGHVTVLFVSPKDTSQVCSGCLKKGPHKDLDERTHTCVHCGLVLDRDVNAAHNILRLGLSHREQSREAPGFLTQGE
jgi:putative transposase